MRKTLTSILKAATACVAVILVTTTLISMKKDDSKSIGAYLEISLDIKTENREAAAGVYLKYKEPFLEKIEGALSKELLIRTEDVQVLHGFSTVEEANGYLSSNLFGEDVVSALKPYLEAKPEVRVYAVFKK